MTNRLVEKARDRIAIGDIAQRSAQFGIAGCERFERCLIDVANINARTLAHEGTRDLPPDSGGAGGNDNTQSSDTKIHLALRIGRSRLFASCAQALDRARQAFELSTA
jgi:hypothetical protein